MKAKKASAAKTKTQNFYDRIADVHNLALKMNGYRSSVSKYLRSLDLEIGPDSYVLDAGTAWDRHARLSGLRFGPGLRCLRPFRNSLSSRRSSFKTNAKRSTPADVVVQGNVLDLPFRTNLSAGTYLRRARICPARRRLSRNGRVLKPAALVLIPVKPSLVGSVLELFTNSRSPGRDVDAFHKGILISLANTSFRYPSRWLVQVNLPSRKAVGA